LSSESDANFALAKRQKVNQNVPVYCSPNSSVLYKHEAVALVQHLDRKIWLDVEAPLKIRLAKATAPNPYVLLLNLI
jgi:ribosomal protein L39E